MKCKIYVLRVIYNNLARSTFWCAGVSVTQELMAITTGKGAVNRSAKINESSSLAQDANGHVPCQRWWEMVSVIASYNNDLGRIRREIYLN